MSIDYNKKEVQGFSKEKNTELEQQKEKNLELPDVISEGRRQVSDRVIEISNENKQIISNIENYPAAESGDIDAVQKIVEGTEVEINNIVKKTEESVSGGEREKEGQSQDDLRGVNIIKRINNKFSGLENIGDFLNISKKIIEKIKNLSDETKEVYWQKMLALAKSEQNNDIYFYKELHDNVLDVIKLNQKNVELKNQETSIDDRVNKCDSFEDMNTLLNSVDSVSGSERKFNSEDLKKIINDIRSFRAPLSDLTRSAGLRDKVKVLLSEPESGIVITPSEIQTVRGGEVWQTQYTPNPELIRLNRGRRWELIDKSRYKELLREVKEEKIGESVDLWNRYNNELFEGYADLVKRNQLEEQINLIRDSLHNELFLQQNSLDEIKENLDILYKKTNIVIYKNLLDYINSSEDAFVGNQESPLFKKIASLKKGTK